LDPKFAPALAQELVDIGKCLCSHGKAIAWSYAGDHGLMYVPRVHQLAEGTVIE
jgi:hypothetical protein